MRFSFPAAVRIPRLPVAPLLLLGGLAWAQTGTAQAASCAANVNCTGTGPDAVKLQALVDGIVSPKVQANGVGGAIVGVTWHGRRSYFGYGFGTTPAFKPDTIVEIGSITKVFTTALFAEAVAENRVRFGDPLRGYMTQLGLSNLDWCAGNVTLLQLANFTSSMPSEPANKDGVNLSNLAPGQKDIDHYSSKDFVDWLARWKPNAEQGTSCNVPAPYNYSNASVGILGYVVANALTGRRDDDWEGVLATRITGPLGMTSTFRQANLQFSDRTAIGYKRDPRTNMTKRADVWPKYAWFPAGELRSDAEDMLAFGAAALGNANINNSPTTVKIRKLEEAMRTSMSIVCPVYMDDNRKSAPLQDPKRVICPNYVKDGNHLSFYQGLAWVMSDSKSVGAPSPTLFYKDGGTDGFKSVIVIDPADDLAIFIALDSAQTNAQGLGTGLATAIWRMNQ